MTVGPRGPAGPTPAQLKAAGLVAVTTYEAIQTAYANGQGPLRTWDTRHQNFPTVNSGYVKAAPVTPPPPPPPPTTAGLPFMLGVNSHMINEGTVNTVAIAAAVSMGMKVYRNDLIWNNSTIAIQTSPGVYNMGQLASVQRTVAALKAAGITPLICVTGGFSTTPGSTPQDLANTMTWLVSQSGLQGLHWEIINEPDGSNTTPAQLTQTMKLAYPAMKKADPTCVVHGLCLMHAAPAGYGNGMDYYNACVALGIVGNYDVLSIHDYNNNNVNYDVDLAPDSLVNNPWQMTMAQRFTHFHANMLAKGDSVPIWITECNWPRTGGNMTPALQSQYLKALLTELSGNDSTGVAFSSYIKAFCIYQMYGSVDGNWGLYPADFPGPYINPEPAVAMLTALTKGT